ncbi:MAG: gliding motility-associated ABC transporter ATP-binding subunit GldA [Bacteroidetes bacterium]|nr:MAG: gliding motility-associated ABC transporter ATP-binding subunit GldA [Bacteroidota bacterium]
MSIRVESISKRYGQQLAVDKVSFRIESGQIAGFIGPNGAGKSTTMKILTATLPSDEGQVFLNEEPLSANKKELRRRIGYLPENNPLYPEMYIREYLAYVAGMYGIKGQRARQKVEEVINSTGLGPEAPKRIAALSKGYRQRVGLAQALIHNPDILILDEPTTGLDPNQLSEIRGLITRIGQEKTILLSTHILQEVEAICDRVIIIDRGRIVADDSAGSLRNKQEDSHTILIEISETLSADTWKALPFVSDIRSLDGKRFLLETLEKRDVRADISTFAVARGMTILSLSRQEKGLEELFRDMTGER